MRTIQRARIRRTLRRLTVGEESVVVYVHNFQIIDALPQVPVQIKVFDYIDNIFGFSELPAHVVELWRSTIRDAALVIVTSEQLRRQVEAMRKDNVIVISNGAEVKRFLDARSLRRPSDLPREEKPIIGYIGSIYPWLDFDLIELLCMTIPHAQVVLIGPAHPQTAHRLQKLSINENFQYLGFREYEDIPAYVGHFAVGIIPFLSNDLTAYVNPVKLYEYCAAGIPVVSTDFSIDLHEFRTVIDIASNHSDFVRAVQRILKDGITHERISDLQEFARQNDWDEKAEVILEKMDGPT